MGGLRGDQNLFSMGQRGGQFFFQGLKRGGGHFFPFFCVFGAILTSGGGDFFSGPKGGSSCVNLPHEQGGGQKKLMTCDHRQVAHLPVKNYSSLGLNENSMQEPLLYLDGSTVFLFPGLQIASKMKTSVLTSRTEQ